MVNYLGEIKGDSFQVVRSDSCPPNRSVSGYGRKIPCPYFVLFGGRKYRVYAICYSNCASHYILISGQMYFLRDGDFPS